MRAAGRAAAGRRSAAPRPAGAPPARLPPRSALAARRALRLEAVVGGAALAVGWTLRLYHLGWQSFWYDEGTSITVAPRDPATILASAAADIHPPLYYLLLHVWVGLTGTSEYAARLPSAMLGTLLIALLFRLGRDLLGAPGGAVAALLAAGAPLPIWYSQEARMYALATTLGALATLLLARGLARPSARLLAAYAAALAGTLYSHYFAAAVPLAHGLAVALWTAGAPRARWPTALRLAAAAGLAAALFLPWVARTYRQLTGWPATSAPFGPGDLLARTGLLFARGYGADRLDPALALPAGLALALGLAWLVWRRPVAALLVGAYLLVPLGLMMYVSLSRPFFHPKFVLLVAPAAELALAAAVVALAGAAVRVARRRQAGLVAAGLAVGLATLYRAEGLRAQYLDPRLARDDYRGLARSIEASARPGDAIVLDAPGQIELFDFYYGGQAPRYPLPVSRPPDERATAERLEALAGDHARVWLVLWADREADPAGLVERWLDERMYRTTSRWWGGVRTALYVNPRVADVRPTRFEVGARFGDLGELAAVEVVGLGARAGEAVPVSLEWRARAPSDARYTAFVHLIDDQEYLWGQHDGEPVGGARPTTAWRAGETVVDRHGVPVVVGTPPGQYRLEVGLYRADTGTRLPVAGGGDRVLVGPLDVQPGRVDQRPSIGRPAEARLGGATLAGADLHPLGQDDGPAEVARGALALLTLWWRADERVEDPPTELSLRLARAGGPTRERPLAVTRGRYPADRWSPGEWVRDPHKLATDDLEPGRYALTLLARGASGRPLGRPDGVSLGELVVR